METNNNINIQDSIIRLQSLYDDLKEEANGSYTTTGVYLAPSAYIYCKKAEALVDEARKLSQVDESLAIDHVLHTFNKEVSYVKIMMVKESLSRSNKKN